MPGKDAPSLESNAGEETDKKFLVDEYVALRIAEELDDVDLSGSTIRSRSDCLNNLEERLTEQDLNSAEQEISDILSKAKNYASGRPLELTASPAKSGRHQSGVTIQDYPVCPEDGSAWKFYDGILGYESLKCPACGIDINDIQTISAKMYSVNLVRVRKF